MAHDSYVPAQFDSRDAYHDWLRRRYTYALFFPIGPRIVWSSRTRAQIIAFAKDPLRSDHDRAAILSQIEYSDDADEAAHPDKDVQVPLAWFYTLTDEPAVILRQAY